MNTSPATTRFAPFLLVLALVIGACGTSSETSTTLTTTAATAAGPVELPTNPDQPKGATIFATLQGDAELDGGCVWLQQTNVDFAVLWPAGFTADFDPIRLYDPAGNLVAEAGDQLVVTGGFASEPADYQPYRCAVGTELWLAGSIEKND
jgi:hypothetical protein